MDLERAARLISEYATVLGKGGAGGGVAVLNELAGFVKSIRGRPRKDLDKLIECARGADRSAGVDSRDRPSTGDIVDLLDRLCALLVLAGAKKDVINEQDLITGWLRGFPESMTFVAAIELLREAMQPPSTEQRVADYIARLNADTGSAEFERTLSELTASNLSREQVVVIAKAVYGGIPKATSRVKAIAFIRRRHDAQVATRLGNEAMGGRSAA